MSIKHPKDFSQAEVGQWLVAIGLGDKVSAFATAGVDGGMLLMLGENDFAELGLSSLQGKKVARSVEVSTSMAGGGGGGGADPELVQELTKDFEALQQENALLKAEVQRLRDQLYPPAATQQQQPPPPQKQQQQQSRPPQRGHVVAGAGVGAARGALLGAVAGAVAGDAKKGAQIGAATGATRGAMGGLAARRRARMMGR